MSAASTTARLFATTLAFVATVAAAAPHDGAHDFDFDVGTWTMHYRRLMHPLANANDWVEMRGRTVVTPLGDAGANLAEVETDGPTGPFELLALRLYDRRARQWTIAFANGRVGTLGRPLLVGTFEDGRGTFYDDEPFDGRVVRVRFTIEAVSPTAVHSEQAFSDDQGRTWETNWITDYTRAP